MARRQVEAGSIARFAGIMVCNVLVILPLLLASCRKPVESQVTLTVLDPEWYRPDELPRRDQELAQFTRETGIKLRHSPTPEATLSQLELWRKLLQGNNVPPDVVGIDVIWPSLLSDRLIDLNTTFQDEIAAIEPQLVANYTVDNKLVAIPYHTLIGVLAYRADLLREYGYKKPPATWDELEQMAARIQSGERAKGRQDFWGFVWQGAPTEGLTCNALEWQMSEGGGSIIEPDKTITVNNPVAIRTWERAKRWIGWISPPSVVAYRELDSSDVWESGRAAFYRTWQWRYRLAQARDSKMGLSTGYTSVPGGRAGRFGTLGGTGLAIASASIHREEALALVRFMIRRELHPQDDGAIGSRPPFPQLVDVPPELYPLSQLPASNQRASQLAFRPSQAAGANYEEVTRAYFETVHAVLTGKLGAQPAAADLEKRLVQITGFQTGPPRRRNDGAP